MITLTAEELRRARRLAGSNGKTAQKRDSFSRKNPGRKSLLQGSPHRSKSRADQHDLLEEVLGDKLAEMRDKLWQGRASATPTTQHAAGRSDTTPVGTTKTPGQRGKSAGKKRRQKGESKSFLFQPAQNVQVGYRHAGHNNRLSEPNPDPDRHTRAGEEERKRHGKDDYYTHSLNLFNLLQKESYDSLNQTKTAEEARKNKTPKMASRKTDTAKKLIVTANNSYIHNLNISSDAFSSCDPRSQDFSVAIPDNPVSAEADKEAARCEKLAQTQPSAAKEKIARSIALELDRRLLDAEDLQGEAKKAKCLEAFRQALLNIITVEPTFGSLLEQIRTGYDSHLESTAKSWADRLKQETAERDKRWAAKLQRVETELSGKSAAAAEQGKTIAEQKRTIQSLRERLAAARARVPPLDLTRLQAEEEAAVAVAAAAGPEEEEKEEMSFHGPTPPTKKEGMKIPALDFGKMAPGAVGYQDEFMAKEEEFSPSWREKLAKEKRF